MKHIFGDPRKSYPMTALEVYSQRMFEGSATIFELLQSRNQGGTGTVYADELVGVNGDTVLSFSAAMLVTELMVLGFTVVHPKGHTEALRTAFNAGATELHTRTKSSSGLYAAAPVDTGGDDAKSLVILDPTALTPYGIEVCSRQTTAEARKMSDLQLKRALTIWALDQAARQEDGPDTNACLAIAAARFDKAAAGLKKDYPTQWGEWSSYPFDPLAFGVQVATCFGEDSGEARARELRKAKDGAGSGAGAAASSSASASASASGVVEGFNIPTF